MKVLVLGGSGFISGAILRDLLEVGGSGGDAIEATVLTRGRARTEWGGLTHLACDRTDHDALRTVLSARWDVVVDVSGYTADDVAGVLAALAAPPDRYVFVSSAAVYDSRRTSIPFRETEGLGGDPVWGTYGVDKFRAEELLRTELGDRVTILRPPYVYGPGNNLDREDFLWARLLEGRPVLVPGDGQTRVQFGHVDSISRFVRSVVSDPSIPSGTYNIGDERSWALCEYIELLAEVAGVSAQLQFVGRDVAAREYFPFRDHPLVLETGRWTDTGHAHVVPFRTGLADTLAWFRERGSIRFDPVPLEAP